MNLMDKTVLRNVTVTAMVVTTSMVPVIKDVTRAGREIPVNNVIYLQNKIINFLVLIKYLQINGFFWRLNTL